MPIRCSVRPNLGLSAPGGFAEYVAVHQSQLYALSNEVTLEHGSRVEPLAVGLRAIVEALNLIGSGTVNVEPLITERVSLADAPDAFVRLRHPGNLVSVLVQPWR